VAAVSHDDWDALWVAHADSNARNPAQQFRRRLVVRLLADHEPVQRLLDIGSGTGDVIADAHARWPAAELLGIELSHTGVEIASHKVPDARFEVVDLIAQPAPLAGREAWATHAVCSEVLEHVDDPVALMANARAWLAPGAVVVVTVPGGPMSSFDRHIGHRRHFAPADLAGVLHGAGYDVLRCSGAGFPFFNVYRSVVIARGDRLIEDTSVGEHGAASRGAELAMAVFRPLLRTGTRLSPRGWQTVAVASVPA